MRILQERQVSALECVYRLCHLNICDSSRNYVFINTREPEKRYQVQRIEGNQASGLCSNIFDRYVNRPRQQEQGYDFPKMCLIEFAMNLNLYYAKKPNDFEQKNELIDEHNNAREAFLAREKGLRQSNTYLETYRARDRQLETVLNQPHAFILLENQEDFVEANIETREAAADQTMANEQIQSVCAAMNFRQKELYNYITQSIEKLFATRGAGVGKTCTFNAVKELVNRCYGHKAIKQLSQSVAQSVEMLCMIDPRLQQLKKKENEPFDDINIVVFDDVYRLQPIRGAQVFNQHAIFIHETHLWRLFNLVELTENMRQQGDTTYADLLNALRIGQLQAPNFDVLMSKLLTEASGESALD
ncbi:hypothetical protein Btru_061215 [Bulinus truncatus]|nr:hypothetical protein Btru_061215 [Bulinus truncatus]